MTASHLSHPLAHRRRRTPVTCSAASGVHRPRTPTPRRSADHDARAAICPGAEQRSAARMALPRRLLQVPAGFNFNPGPGGQPAKQPWAAQPPPDVRGGSGGVPVASPAEPQLVPSLNGVAMAGVVASASSCTS